MGRWILVVLAVLLTGGVLARAEGPDAVLDCGETAVPSQGPPAFAEQACLPSRRCWATSESLLWWFKNSPVPVPLVTSGAPPASLSSTTFPGTLGVPNTQVAIGGAGVDTGSHWGGRFTTGYWLDDGETVGVEASYLFLAGGKGGQTVATSGLPGSANLAVPYFDVTGAAAGQHDVPGEAVFVLPGPLQGFSGQVIPGFAGVMTLATASRLQGAGLNGTWQIQNNGRLCLGALAGFTWLQLREDLTFGVQSVGLPGGFPFLAGNFFNTRDQFSTVNNFYGGRDRTAGRVSVQSLFPARNSGHFRRHRARETADVFGATQTSNGNISYHTQGTAGQVLPGGIFAQQTNGGSHGTNRFAVATDVTLTGGYRLARWATLSVGYSFLLIADVARPGDQIDRQINSTLTGLAAAARMPTTGPALPSFPFQNSSFSAQGITFGLELQF